MPRPAITRLLPRPVLPAIWRELAAFERNASALPAPPVTDRRRPVLLIPGLFAGDAAMAPLAAALRAAGHDPHPTGIRCNIGCSEEAVARVECVAEHLCERRGERIAVVGHSRGGLFARVLACRRPDLVSSVITLGSPYRDQLAVHPLVWVSAALVATAGTLRFPGMLRWSCGASRCCVRFDRDLASRLPGSVDVLSVYSRLDGVVDWRACVEPSGRRLEVASTHCGMPSHAPTLWAVTTAIATANPRSESSR